MAGTTGRQSGPLVINEFMADNGSGLVDADGDYADWIEIYNGSDQPVNLAGWSLTDDPAQPEKWPFPEMNLDRGEYLLVFASDKDRRAGADLHANFKLSKNGEFLGLYNLLRREFVDVVEPPEQFRDIAYGRYGEPQAYGYLAAATPGGANDESRVWAGVVSRVEFGVSRGFFTAPFTLTLSTATAGATIRYTMDGSEPTEAEGLVYTGPITIAGSTPVRAAAFKPGFLPAYVDTHSYIFLADVLVQPAQPPGYPTTWGTSSEALGGYQVGELVRPDYEMDPEIVNHPRYGPELVEGLRSIPSLVLVMPVQSFEELYTNPRERGVAWERPVSAEWIEPDGSRPGFQVNAGLRIQGGAGRREFVPKHSFRLFFKGQYGPTKLEYPLFADSPVERFDTIVLRGGVSRSYGGHPNEWRENRKAAYTRDEWLRASQVAMSGLSAHGRFVHLYINGLYWGLYNVVERPDASFMAAYLGGDKEDWYAINQDGLVSGPDYQVRELLSTFATIGDPVERYQAARPYLDTTQFIDYIILNWYTGTKDWPHNNWYIGIKSPFDKFRFFVWDGERSWIDGADIRLGESNEFAWPNFIKPLFKTLMHDPDFRMQFADRMYKHLFNNGALTDANAQARWLELNNGIEQAIVAESARWGDAGQEPPLTLQDWLAARDDVLAQMEGNAARLVAMAREDGYYPPLDPPRFGREGGLVSAGFELSMEAARGTIYYTTDGSDPRLGAGAAPYRGPVVLTTTTTIKARTRLDDTWSALHEAAFRVVGQDRQLRITEIMYNPVGGAQYEFIELQNTGQLPVELGGMSFGQGIRFAFPPRAAPLEAGQVVVLARDPAAFARRYPGVAVFGSYQGQLANQGELITLQEAGGEVVLSVAYDDENGWPVSPDGRGDSLVLVAAEGDPNEPANWRASALMHGSPGRTDLLAGVR